MKAFSLILCASAACLAAEAQDISGYPIGFCNGEYVKSSKVKFDGKDVEVSAAIFIPSSYAATVAGNNIETIRVALCSKHNVDDIRVWVRETLDAGESASGTMPIADYAQGWNEVRLDSPFSIADGTQGFYLGYTYHQTGKSGAIAIVENTREQGLLVRCGDGEWEDRSADGILSIEGMVYGEHLPKLNAQLLSVTTDKVFIKSDGTLNGVAEVRNNATEVLRELEITADVAGASEKCVATVECEIPYGETTRVGFSINPDMASSDASETDAIFTLTALNGSPDEDPADNTAEASFRIVERAFPRVALVEEFTTENCPNCPRVAGYIHDMLADPEYADRMAVLCHHAGYGEDFLTTPFAEEYTWFYNSEGTYAPATMVDRLRHGETECSPLFCPGSPEELMAAVSDRLEEPAMVSVNIDQLMPTSQGAPYAYLSVWGERVDAAAVSDDVRITVMLVENDIPANRQGGAGEGYLHQHVGRAVNATWGETIEWHNNEYYYDIMFDFDPSWNQENLQAVAFISNYNSDKVLDCMVENAAVCKVTGTSGAVDEIGSDHNRSLRRIMTPDGIVHSAPVKGLNILLYDDGTTRRIIVKE